MPEAKPSRRRDLIEIVLFMGVVVADAFGLVPLTQTVFLLPLIWIALRLRGERWRSIGFSLPERPWRLIMIGVTAGIAMEAFAMFVTTPLLTRWFGIAPDHSDLAAITGNLTLLLVFLALSWTLAAVGEEICFRGFLMERIARVVGGGNTAWVVALFLSSLVFGWGHTEQGIVGWVQEGLSGFLLGVLFLATGKNLFAPIVAHGVANSIAFVLIYLGRYPGLGT